MLARLLDVQKNELRCLSLVHLTGYMHACACAHGAVAEWEPAGLPWRSRGPLAARGRCWAGLSTWRVKAPGMLLLRGPAVEKGRGWAAACCRAAGLPAARAWPKWRWPARCCCCFACLWSVCIDGMPTPPSATSRKTQQRLWSRSFPPVGDLRGEQGSAWEVGAAGAADRWLGAAARRLWLPGRQVKGPVPLFSA